MNDQIEKPEIKREFPLSTWALKNSVSVFILTAIVAIVGFNSYTAMPKEQFPEIVMPTIYVNTIYPGNSPSDIENLITRHIEKQLKTVKGVKKIESTSAMDVSAVIIEFNEDVKVSKALQDVKDAVDEAKKDLPNDLDKEPQVRELDFTEIPIMSINLSGDFEIDKLNQYAEKLEDEIEALVEVTRVDITGNIKREIQINVDPFKMDAMRVTFGDVESAIARENITISGGDVISGGYRRSLRVSGEFSKVNEIEDVIVKSEKGATIYIRDIAEVVDSYEDRKSFARLATQNFMQEGSFPVVSLKVIKKSGENLINADAKIMEILEKAKRTFLPPNLNMVITENQADQMKTQISGLENNIISGVILVVAVLLFFMGLRNSLFVGIAIPLSMLLSFMVLNALGITINIVVLFAMILALGMLVDNGIVVVENSYRLIEEGLPLKKSALEGVGEVAIAIIASTATTVAAFMPLAFWGGIMGEFMKYLPITLIIVLSASLFVGLVINPVFIARYMRLEEPNESTPKIALRVSLGLIAVSVPFYLTAEKSYVIPNLLFTFGFLGLINIFFLKKAASYFQNKMLPVLEKAYLGLIQISLKGNIPFFIVAGSFLLLIGSIALFALRVPSVELFPSGDPRFVFWYIEFPLGTDVKTTDSTTKVLEKKLYTVLEPYQSMIKSVVTNVGEGTGDPQERSVEFTPHKSKITVSFVDYNKRGGISTSEVMRKMSEYAKTIPGIKIKTDKNNDGPPVGKPISIEVTGEDYLTLIEEAEKIERLIEDQRIPGIDELSLEIEVGKPELLLTLDRNKARRFGLSTGMIATDLRTAIYGKEVSKFKDGDDDHPIQLRLREEYRHDPTILNERRVTFQDNRGQYHQVPISALGSIEYSSSFGSIKRKDLNKLIRVSSNVIEGYNANEIVAEIKTLLKNHHLPQGYNMRFGGEQEEQSKSAAFLGNALLVALAAIFLILVTQFNSFTKPFIIMVSVLFSMIGVFLGLTIFKDNFVIVMTGIGIISLAGVVVNNAIVLVDYTEFVRQRKRSERGLSEDELLPISDIELAVAEAGFKRLRPVLLTAITTILGLIPLATGLNIDFVKFYAVFDPDFYIGGENAQFWGPMAWTVIYGLTFSTFLTLIVVPAMYMAIERIQRIKLS
jgi:multidrug efflux pump subunit AcrB